jgi:hypothetical protein
MAQVVTRLDPMTHNAPVPQDVPLTGDLPVPGEQVVSGDLPASGDQPTTPAPDGPQVPHRLPDALVRQPLIEVSADRAVLRLPGAGRMLVTTHDIVGAPAPGRGHGALAPLADPALALQWLLRGVPTVRAASVASNGRGVLLSGTGPVGTSTIAAALVQRGWQMLGDAVAPVIVADGTISVVPTTDTLGLWPDALEALGLDAELGQPIRSGVGKRAVTAGELVALGTPPGDSAIEDSPSDDVAAVLGPLPVPVDMVVLVRQSNHDPLGAAVYSGTKAFTAVGRSSWHHAIALALHSSTGHFAWSSALATGARIVRVTVPRRGDPTEAAALVAGISDGTIEVAPA